MAVLRALEADIKAVAEAFAATAATLAARAKAGDLDETTLRHIETELAGYEDSIDEIRAVMDAQQVSEALAIQRGDLNLAVWGWERENRQALVRLRPKITAAKQVARKLLEGVTARVHVVRAGETLQSIAQSELGDWRDWGLLLKANPDINPGSPLSTGTHLNIPRT